MTSAVRAEHCEVTHRKVCSALVHNLALLEMMIVAQLVVKFTEFMKPERLLPRSQGLDTGPYPLPLPLV